ncbi:hypothetical protein DPMN_044819 [Dreissena polymorpha]|uniref:Uncharacterized protein n=1 Tax=Dreissena polymorpha TaxID=45954 RepID=A0A9D4I0T7_DREPO|nr:hypothetical protein DPMN_044819 [Dreissena polymorpha]
MLYKPRKKDDNSNATSHPSKADTNFDKEQQKQDKKQEKLESQEKMLLGGKWHSKGK